MAKKDEKLKVSEHDEQAALFQWAQLSRGRYPELGLMFAVPNWRPKEGQRIYLAAEGVKPGVPDIWLPVPRGGFHGLIIELKVAGGKLSSLQKSWIEALQGQGYCAMVCVGFDVAKEAIEDYLNQEGRE
jgi:hypothetical protein